MPASFRFQFWSGVRELWVPAAWTRGDYEPGSNSFVCIGRLKPEVTLVQARSEMDAIGRSMSQERQDAGDVGLTAVLEPMNEYGLTELRRVMVTMLAVVGFVLLIACVNVANLMLARAAIRQREFAIRSAVGAGRWRIVQQLLIESLLLGCVGGAGGLVIALWTTSLLVPLLPGNLTFLPMRPLDGIELDGHVLAFTTAVSMLSGILFGLAPAVAAFRDDLANPLKENARGSIPGARSRLRYGLVASEVALTLVTLAGAGIMIVSVSRLLGVDPGLDPKNVLVMEMSLPQEDLYYGPPDHAGFCQALDTQVRSIPGVLSVSGIAHLPIGGGNAGRSIGIEGQPDPGPERRPGANYTVACPNILRTLGIKLLAGREFTQQDTVGAPGAALINQAMARRFWRTGDAVGKRFKIGGVNSDNPWLTVVGVFDNVRQGGLDQEPQSWFIRSYSQAGWPSMSIVTKTAAAPASFTTLVKKATAIVEPNQPVSYIRTMDQVVGDSVSSRRFPMLLLERVRDAGAGSRGGGHRRRRRVFRRPAHAGDRRTHGAWRRDPPRAATGDRSQHVVDAGGHRRGPCGVIRRAADAARPRLRRDDDRSARARRGVGASCHRSSGCQLHSGPSRHARQPGDSAALRLAFRPSSFVFRPSSFGTSWRRFERPQRARNGRRRRDRHDSPVERRVGSRRSREIQGAWVGHRDAGRGGAARTVRRDGADLRRVRRGPKIDVITNCASVTDTTEPRAHASRRVAVRSSPPVCRSAAGRIEAHSRPA